MKLSPSGTQSNHKALPSRISSLLHLRNGSQAIMRLLQASRACKIRKLYRRNIRRSISSWAGSKQVYCSNAAETDALIVMEAGTAKRTDMVPISTMTVSCFRRRRKCLLMLSPKLTMRTSDHRPVFADIELLPGLQPNMQHMRVDRQEEDKVRSHAAEVSASNLSFTGALQSKCCIE